MPYTRAAWLPNVAKWKAPNDRFGVRFRCLSACLWEEPVLPIGLRHASSLLEYRDIDWSRAVEGAGWWIL